MALRHTRSEHFDVVTPTEHERRDDDIARRRKSYFLIMIPCIVLFVGFGYLLPVPTPVRVMALGIAAVLPPIAAVVANRSRR
jgi:Protein of unknown function (DUF3099)